MKNVSLVVPTIRLDRLPGFMESLSNSITEFSYEVVFISPYERPKTLSKYNNIKWLKDFGSPSRCTQLGFFEANGELVYHTVDDGLFIPGKVDEAIKLYKKCCSRKDVVNMRYKEGPGFSGQEVPKEWWLAHYHKDLQLPGIPKNFKISLHPLMNKEYLIEMGGLDCSFMHANFNLHDLMFRIQYDGGKLFDSPATVLNCDQYAGDTGDHKPIFDSHNEEDLPRFRTLYSDPDILKKRKKIDVNNWADSPFLWERRFGNEK